MESGGKRHGIRSSEAARLVRARTLGTLVSLWLAAATEAAIAQAPPAEQARVPTSHANVHKGPSSNDEVLVLVPQDTVLPVIGRRGEWIEVQLAPALRETGMVIRWYANEDRGWMHDSTVEITASPTR